METLTCLMHYTTSALIYCYASHFTHVETRIGICEALKEKNESRLADRKDISQEFSHDFSQENK